MGPEVRQGGAPTSGCCRPGAVPEAPPVSTAGEGTGPGNPGGLGEVSSGGRAGCGRESRGLGRMRRRAFVGLCGRGRPKAVHPRAVRLPPAVRQTLQESRSGFRPRGPQAPATILLPPDPCPVRHLPGPSRRLNFLPAVSERGVAFPPISISLPSRVGS